MPTYIEGPPLPPPPVPVEWRSDEYVRQARRDRIIGIVAVAAATLAMIVAFVWFGITADASPGGGCGGG